MRWIHQLSSAKPVLHWRLLAGFFCLLGVFLSFGYQNSHSSSIQRLDIRFDFEQQAGSSILASSQPEDYLQQIQSLLDASEYAVALKHTESLINAFPNFQLGHWLYADLLKASTDAPQVDALSELGAQDKHTLVEDLKKELRLRLHALRTQAPRNMIPSGLGYLAASTEHFAVVDASTSRIYVFKNTSSPERPVQLELLYHAYASIGLNGIHKQEEGDGRTPIGVYFTQKTLPDKRLPDLYGSGALTLNYPNFYDVKQGRTGSGIWIHGTPSAQYSRAPQASDGCIVLSNDIMSRLMTLNNPKGIPLMVQERIHWVPPEKALELPETLGQQITEKYQPVRARQDGPASALEQYKQLGIVHFLSWRDQERTVALLDLASSPKGPVRTYWVEQDKTWNLVAETPL